MASKDDTFPSERIAAVYKQLAVAAAELNTASDELGKSIAALDVALRRLNLGISAWIEFAGDMDAGTGDFWTQSVGYAKVGSRWGIAICNRAGNYHDPRPDTDDEWLFNAAPRALRVDAVRKLPDLLQELLQVADKTTAKIKDETAHAKTLASAVSKVAQPAGMGVSTPTSSSTVSLAARSVPLSSPTNAMRGQDADPVLCQNSALLK